MDGKITLIVVTEWIQLQVVWRVLGLQHQLNGATTILENLFSYTGNSQSPGGAFQWKPANNEGQGTVPDAHDPELKHAPMMLTTDLALREDPAYEKISRRFYENPDQLATHLQEPGLNLPIETWGP